MIRFIDNTGDYFSQNFFDEDFPRKVFERSSFDANHIKDLTGKLTPLREKYFKFKNRLLNARREKDRVELTHGFHMELLDILGYVNGTPLYDTPVHLTDEEVIPVVYRCPKGDKPYLFIMEMKAIVQQGDQTTDGIYEQTYDKQEWESVFPDKYQQYTFKPSVIKEALSELFILPEEVRPQYVIMLAGAKIYLIHYEKWKYDSFLLFDLEELFVESQIPANKNYLALFYALLAKPQFISPTDSVLTVLEEDAHKAAYGVTESLKSGVIFAVENLANEAIHYMQAQANASPEAQQRLMARMHDERFARELKDECLTFVYRLLFLFYAEAREDLQILPVRDGLYQKGYSLEMLRDLEMVPLTTDSSRNGYFFSDSLWKLFRFLHQGHREQGSFEMKPLDSPLFDNENLKHLKEIRFRNHILQQVIRKLSLSERTAKKGRGRISYANLGINQLGSVYESLLAYSGFFATEALIEIKPAGEKPTATNTYLVPKSRRDDFEEDEICKVEDSERDVEIEKGRFVYRLNGRDRKNSASYYTPEVLTQTTVKYTLKGIIDKLKERQQAGENCADEILKLKILEPAMGAAAFHNEAINQLSVAYLELKEKEEIRAGRRRIDPGNYNNERQKVKAYIASNNVYGVDLNPTAVELGRLSLWLNCMHREMETPFFAHRLGTGNAVIGAKLKAYDRKEFIAEYPEGKKTPLPKSWWDKAPVSVQWTHKKLSRKQNQIYHFLLPDENMLASANISLLKQELTDAERRHITEWKKEFKKPITGAEFIRLQKISVVIDALFEEHYKQMKTIIEDTASIYKIYGQSEIQYRLKGYMEKERLSDSRNNRVAPYCKLKNVMDYWCSLWFWDARRAADLPTREQWYAEITTLLGVDLAHIPENADKAEVQKILKEKGAYQSNMFAVNRLEYVEELAQKYRFFHDELEFVEVFYERGGFDVIVGNPPWIKIQFEEKGIIAEKYPEIAIRDTTASEVKEFREEVQFLSDLSQKEQYLDEFISTESSAVFMNGKSNYPLLRGQQTNLYKCIIENGFDLLAEQGFMGLLHPEGTYEDPKGQIFRYEAYQRLKYHFQFQNELLLFKEVHDQIIYSLNVYKGVKSSPNFYSINNLFHPSTIDGCFIHDGKGLIHGIKVKNDKGKMQWNVLPHKDRIVPTRKDELQILAKTFENSDYWEGTKLVSIHAFEIMNVLKKIGSMPYSVKDFTNKVSECWHETNDEKRGFIEKKKNTVYPDFHRYEMIYSGPHFYVSNPLYQSPRKTCVVNSDYDNVNIANISDEYLPRTKYIPKNVSAGYGSIIKGFPTGEKNKSDDKPLFDNWLEYYKIGFRKMLNLPGERTLTGAIIPPSASHVNGIISVIFKEEDKLVEFTGITSSLILDFLIKTINKSNLYDVTIQSLPLGLSSQYLPSLFSRTLQLNCVTTYYSFLWERHWNDIYLTDLWSKSDPRLKPFDTLTPEWQYNTPLRNYYERRWALVEIDVIVAMAFSLTLEELIDIYNIQFSVLQQNEEDTWYDQRGNIIFTCAQGLTGVGLDRKEWDNITQEVNPMQRTLKSGDSYEHTITKSELYHGQKVTYYPPFDKCDRVEDYKTVWQHFKERFGQ